MAQGIALSTVNTISLKYAVEATAGKLVYVVLNAKTYIVPSIAEML